MTQHLKPDIVIFITMSPTITPVPVPNIKREPLSEEPGINNSLPGIHNSPTPEEFDPGNSMPTIVGPTGVPLLGQNPFLTCALREVLQDVQENPTGLPMHILQGPTVGDA